ncbi:unnamed protein product [marine sediment metagenome]|uniref:Uncharacterized protein n=1 Tax=marine sediment metagenome TaxID=412755 RepID=X1QGM0_9ZZZZ
MRTMKKLVCALALTVLLIAVMAVDGTMVLTGSADAQIGEAPLGCAAAGPFPEIRLKKPHYDEDHNLIGCWGKGTKCVIVVMDVAGQERQLSIAAGGVLLR